MPLDGLFQIGRPQDLSQSNELILPRPGSLDVVVYGLVSLHRVHATVYRPRSSRTMDHASLIADIFLAANSLKSSGSPFDSKKSG